MEEPKNKFRVIINHNSETKVDIKKWQLKPFYPGEDEPNRVSIDYNGKSYSFVMLGDDVTIEVWELDGRDEIFKMTEVLTPKKSLIDIFKNKIKNICGN